MIVVPVWTLNILIFMILVLGVISLMALMLFLYCLVTKSIVNSIFESSGVNLIAKEFGKYYKRGLSNGSIKITPLMQKIADFKNRQ